MTDEQIIKALRCCGMRDCGKCPYVGFKEECSNLSILALDLIDRQKEEIERLKKNIDGLNIFTTNHTKVIRVQAIKEFAERLKRYSFVDNLSLNGKETVYVADIDNIIKEMTEVQE